MLSPLSPMSYQSSPATLRCTRTLPDATTNTASATRKSITTGPFGLTATTPQRDQWFPNEGTGERFTSRPASTPGTWETASFRGSCWHRRLTIEHERVHHPTESASAADTTHKRNALRAIQLVGDWRPHPSLASLDFPHHGAVFCSQRAKASVADGL